MREVEELRRGGVCTHCWNAVPPRDDGRCARCDETLPGRADADGLCGRCLLDPPGFERLEGAAPYREAARRILLAFKFEGADFLGARLAEMMTARLAAPDADEVVAVPATPRARRARGYHPAAVLAAEVARRLGRSFAPDRLRKVRETEIQSRVRAAGRAANVRRAFSVEGASPRRILLVDDVATSGATARECAARLAAAGAERVSVWCFARASRGDLAAPEKA
ncbi:MAG TPA: ComF family protein [Thermoanaerobaculia bacterium]|nr:ComF family protein [Thermoanaerobaculia bacterium]